MHALGNPRDHKFKLFLFKRTNISEAYILLLFIEIKHSSCGPDFCDPPDLTGGKEVHVPGHIVPDSGPLPQLLHRYISPRALVMIGATLLCMYSLLSLAPNIHYVVIVYGVNAGRLRLRKANNHSIL